MHAEARAFVADAVAGRTFGRVVEVGSRDVNGVVRDLFGDCEYLGIDMTDGPGVDLVADGATVRLPRKADAVVCCEVLEHTPDAEAIVKNLLRLVRRGGLVIVTAACDPRPPHSATDGGPVRDGEFYANVSPADLDRWLNTGDGSGYITANETRGDVYAWVER
jgi:SAM-dependent methyltransferase